MTLQPRYEKLHIVLATALSLLLFVDLAVAQTYERTRIFQAEEVASIDFLKRLNNEKKYDWEYSEFVSNFRNYDIGLSEGHESFYVVLG